LTPGGEPFEGLGAEVSFIMRLAVPGDLEPLVKMLGILFTQEEEFHAQAPNQRRGLQALLSDPHSRMPRTAGRRSRSLVAEVEGRIV